MKLLIVILAGLFVMGGLTPIGAGQAQGLLLVAIQPAELQQGRTALIRVQAPAEITRVEMRFAGRQTPLFFSVDGDWVGFLPADLAAERGENPVEVLAWRGDEALPPQTEKLNIIWGGFLYQDIPLPNALVPLLDPELNKNEEDRISRIYSRFTPQKLWQGGLLLPVTGPMISEFGGIRTYNNGLLQSRHTGMDFRAGTGEPARASGNGRVVFAGFLPIRGNHVIIDHGIGVLTGYSHLNEIYVVPGQRLLAGDVIGTVGATGRTQGAHMHFEVAVNGSWVDPLQFLNLPIPDEAAGPLVGGPGAAGGG